MVLLTEKMPYCTTRSTMTTPTQHVGVGIGWSRFFGKCDVRHVGGADVSTWHPKLDSMRQAIAACSGTCCFLCCDGQTLWALGTVVYGEIPGRSEGCVEQTQVPLPLGPSTSIRQLACGPHHVMASLNGPGGGMLAWGLDARRQTLGMGDCGQCLTCTGDESGGPPARGAPAMRVLEPRRIPDLEGQFVLQFATGENHTLCVVEGDLVLAWGCGRSGQLGIGKVEGDCSTCAPRRVEWPSGEECITDVAVGKRHSMVLTSRGRVFTFGSGLYHSLGHGSTGFEHIPRVVEALEGLGEMLPGGIFSGIARIACGAWHSAALTTTGDLYVWGWSKHGQCGGDTDALCSLPRLLKPAAPGLGDDADVTFDQIGCGHRYTAALETATGRMHILGCVGLVHPTMSSEERSDATPGAVVHDIDTIVSESLSSQDISVSTPVTTEGSGKSEGEAEAYSLVCGPWNVWVWTIGVHS